MAIFDIVANYQKHCRITGTPQNEKARNCSDLLEIIPGMTVLEIIAEQRLGTKNLARHPRLRAALQRIDHSARRRDPGEEEKARIASVVDLCFAYERETDAEEKATILRSLQEVSENEPLELPTETIEEWEAKLGSKDSAFAKAKQTLDRRRREFQKRYFLTNR